MPTYRLQCSECGKEIKIRINIAQLDDYTDMICEFCNEGILERMVPKGISTIYRGGGYTKSAKKEVKDDGHTQPSEG